MEDQLLLRKCAGDHSAVFWFWDPDPCPFALFTTNMYDRPLLQYAVPLKLFFDPVGSASALLANSRHTVRPAQNAAALTHMGFPLSLQVGASACPDPPTGLHF
jgi:hypothetical protein